MTTRIAGGLLLGCNPVDADRGLKPPALASFRPDGPSTHGAPVEPASARSPAKRIPVLLGARSVRGYAGTLLPADALRYRGPAHDARHSIPGISPRSSRYWLQMAFRPCFGANTMRCLQDRFVRAGPSARTITIPGGGAPVAWHLAPPHSGWVSDAARTARHRLKP